MHLVEEVQLSDYKAVLPTANGQSWITGYYKNVVGLTNPIQNVLELVIYWHNTAIKGAEAESPETLISKE